jgi:peptidoglycan/xylan/chitin deacetylase (PgdA/CDA1 family)
MRIVSPLLKRVVYPALSMTGVFQRTPARGLAVLTYHGVLPPGYEPVDAGFDGNLITAETLSRQLRRLKTHYNVISPEDVHGWRRGSKLPERAVLITCDDGLLNCLTDMLPVLQGERVSCLFFVTGDSAEESRATLWYEELFLLLLRVPDGPFEISASGIVIQSELASREQRRALWWDTVKRLSRVDVESRGLFVKALRVRVGMDMTQLLADVSSASYRRYGLMTRAELQQLAAAGMSIGAHTMSHPMLSLMPAEFAYTEIAESRMRIEAALQQNVWAFAYPFGDPQSVTSEVLAMPPRAGLEAAFLNYGGGLGTRLPGFALPRIHVTAGMSTAELEAHVSGFYTRLQRRIGRRPDSFEVTQDAPSR